MSGGVNTVGGARMCPLQGSDDLAVGRARFALPDILTGPRRTTAAIYVLMKRTLSAVKFTCPTRHPASIHA